MENAKSVSNESQSVRQIKQTFHLINRHKGLIAAVFCTTVTVTFLFLAYQTRVWRAVAKIDVASGMSIPLSEIYRQTSQVEILKSKTVQKRLLQNLAAQGWMQVIPQQYWEPDINLQFLGSNTTVVKLQIDSPYPDYAVAYADALISEYTLFTREQKSESADLADQELSKQIDELKKDLDAGEQKLLSYKSSHDIVLYDEVGNLPARYAAELRIRLSDLITQRSILKHQLNALKNNNDPYVIESALMAARNYSTPTVSVAKKSSANQAPSSDSQSGEISSQRGLPSVYLLAENETSNYQQTKSRLRQLKENLAAQLKIYKGNHPQIIALKNEISGLENQLDSEVENLTQRLNARYQTLKLEQTALEKALNNWEGKATSTNVRGSEYENLRDGVDLNKKMYATLVQRQNEISVSSELGERNIQIIEGIHLQSRPVSPKTARTMLISVFLGVCFGLGTSIGIEYLDDTIHSAEDLQKYIGLQTMASIPNFRLWDNKPASERLIRVGGHHSPILEAFRTLRTSLLQSSQGHNHSILITSSVQEEGKSLVSANLAVSLAQAGQKTLLVDADLRKSALHRFFNLSQEKGLTEFLSGKAALEEIIQPTGIENLSVITAGRHPDNPPELLSSPALKDLIRITAEKFERIIIDSPPVITVTESTILGSLVDGIIIVIRGAEIPEILVNRSLEILENSGGRVIGGVINRLSEKDLGYYSYHYSRYYYGYHYQQPQPEKVKA